MLQQSWGANYNINGGPIQRENTLDTSLLGCNYYTFGEKIHPFRVVFHTKTVIYYNLNGNTFTINPVFHFWITTFLGEDIFLKYNKNGKNKPYKIVQIAKSTNLCMRGRNFYNSKEGGGKL